MYLMHVYLQLKISRSYISTIPATSMHYKSYRTVPQTLRHNSGTIVHVTGLYSRSFANGMECIIAAFSLAGLECIIAAFSLAGLLLVIG